MSFGDIIAAHCAEVERKHGKFRAWLSSFWFIGSSMATGAIIAGVLLTFMSWTVEKDYPNLSPCNQPKVCDTYAHFVKYNVTHFVEDDLKHLW